MKWLEEVEYYREYQYDSLQDAVCLPSSQSEMMEYIAPAVRTRSSILRASENEGISGPSCCLVAQCRLDLRARDSPPDSIL